MRAVSRVLVAIGLTIAVGLVLLTGVSIVMYGPIVEPAPHLAVRMMESFPGDVVAADSGDDHGWWYFEIDPASEREPLELCQAILDEMAAQGEWGWPGIGIELASFDWQDGRRIMSSKTSVHCGQPDLLGRKPFDA